MLGLGCCALTPAPAWAAASIFITTVGSDDAQLDANVPAGQPAGQILASDAPGLALTLSASALESVSSGTIFIEATGAISQASAVSLPASIFATTFDGSDVTIDDFTTSGALSVVASSLAFVDALTTSGNTTINVTGGDLTLSNYASDSTVAITDLDSTGVVTLSGDLDLDLDGLSSFGSANVGIDATSSIVFSVDTLTIEFSPSLPSTGPVTVPVFTFGGGPVSGSITNVVATGIPSGWQIDSSQLLTTGEIEIAPPAPTVPALPFAWLLVTVALLTTLRPGRRRSH